MSHRKPCRAILSAALVALLLGSVAFAAQDGKKKNKSAEYVVTESELQADLMSYADRYASYAAQAIDDVLNLGPTPEVRRLFSSDLIYSATAAYTIAADGQPQIALLDMTVLATLGRMVFEDTWRPRYGAIADPVVTALEKLEQDVWQVANRILTAEQKAELRERIEGFRLANPELTAFSHLRFADFPSKRATSTLKKTSGGGIFKSVNRITDQVEQTRMLAERGVYLSTRLPLLAGFFADIWISQLSMNPAVEQLLGDVHAFADVSERLTEIADELPAQIADERDEAIRQLAREVAALREETVDHLFERITKERNETIEQFAAEEQRLKGVLTELSTTLGAANELTGSVGGLVEKLGIGTPKEGKPSANLAQPAKPFDINDYRATLGDAGTVIRDLDTLVGAAQRLLDSPGGERLLPQLASTIQEAGNEGEEIIDALFLRAVLLIVIGLAGIVIAMLAYRWLVARLVG